MEPTRRITAGALGLLLASAVAVTLLVAPGGRRPPPARPVAGPPAGTATAGAQASPPDSPGGPAAWRTTWRPGIPGGVPAVTAIHSRLDAARFGDGTGDAADAINAAIQAAGDAAAATRTRQVVHLGPGTFRLASHVALNRSDVVLRGSGAGRTVLVVDNPFVGILVGRLMDYGPAWDVVGSIPRGAASFQLSNADAANVEVGDVLEIDQRDPPAALRPGTRLYFNGDVWLGDGHYNKRQPRTDFNGPGTGGVDWVYPAPSHLDPALDTWENAVNYNARFTGPWRSAGQQVEVSGKSRGPSLTTFTTSNVFHLAFEASRAPQAWHTGSRWTPARNVPGTQWVGVEDLRVVGGPGARTADNGGISARNVAYCWVKDVEISGDASGGQPGLKGPLLSMQHAFRCVVRGTYVHHSRILRPNSASYGIHTSNHCTDNLFEDNIATWLGKPIVFNASGGGNVVAYNYVDNAVIEGSGWSENGIDLCHSSFCFGDLAEGNWSPNIGSDSTHGNAGFETIFRNHCSGRNSTGTPAPDRNLRAIGADAWSGPHAVVGNVLHAAEVGAGIDYEATPGKRPRNPARGLVYRLGDNGAGGRGDHWDDGTAAANLYRHGNWDNVTGGQAWDAHTPDRVLPASLYLTGKPAFFGTLPWPWVEPGGATGPDRVRQLPAKVRFDAGRPAG